MFSSHRSPARCCIWNLLRGFTLIELLIVVAIIAILAAISFWKGAVIILDFMALRHAPLMWRVVSLGWMVVVWAVIAIAYIKGLPQ